MCSVLPYGFPISVIINSLLFQMRTGMVCSPVPALMIWQVPPVRNSPRQFFEKGGNPVSQAPG
ncbi:hypothetical protein DXB02_00835 [Blautia sp. OF11-22]|nr:hypothetical protein DXB02_00835 [Blautia sp. OF11-22]